MKTRVKDLTISELRVLINTTVEHSLSDYMEDLKALSSPGYNMILSRIYARHRGWVFTPMQSLDLGSRMAVDQTLGRLTKSGTIRRLTRGLYDYPSKHPDFGNLPPNNNGVAQALVGRNNLKIQPSGAYAANLLGLTEQVPAKIVFFTDGPNRIVPLAFFNWLHQRCSGLSMPSA